jgi:pimeloyl-ACP methyl ester carboxylesterase
MFPAPPAHHAPEPQDPFPGPPIDADIYRIPVGPGALHVQRYGFGGAPVVLLHGFGTSSFLWREIGPRLAVRRHTAYAIDLFGHGESDRPFDADFGVAAQSEYIERTLTALRIPRAVVVGVDLGAAVALRLAATRRERVGRMVLINPSAFQDLPGDDVRALQRKTARVAFRISSGLFGVNPLLVPLLEDAVADPAHMSPRLIGRYLAPYIGREGVNHLLALARAIRADDLEEVELGDITAPTLIVWGEADRWLDASIADRLASTIPESSVLRLPGVGRLVPEEAPERLAEVIAEFAAERSTAQA